jgi:hypothetical protein
MCVKIIQTGTVWLPSGLQSLLETALAQETQDDTSDFLTKKSKQLGVSAESFLSIVIPALRFQW